MFDKDNYILNAKTQQIQDDFIDYIDNHIDSLDTIPQTNLTPFWGDYKLYDIFFMLWGDTPKFKADCLRLVQLLSAQYDILAYNQTVGFSADCPCGICLYLKRS